MPNKNPQSTELVKKEKNNDWKKEYIKQNWCSTKSISQIAQDVSLSLNGVRHIANVILKLPQRREALKEHTALEEECNKVGIPISSVGNYWYKGKSFSIHSKNKQVDFEEIKNEIIKEVKKYSPKYEPIKYNPIKDGHLMVISPADIHIGKLCKAFETEDEYNHQIAIDRVKSGVLGLLNKAQGFKIDKILLIIGNDILHVDNAKSTTTSGTLQDSSMMWYDAFMVAKKLYIEVIEMLMQVAPVHVDHNPDNHSYVTSFLLAQTIEAWFSKSKNITFNTSISHRKYFVYGKNICGSTHGDGAKETDLALLMAHECKEWNICTHRYFYTHHIHHKRSKDYMSVCVESMRSPSGTDSWHHRNGYQHSPKAIECFIHHKEHGQIAKFIHLF
jgi:hypothetical protein